MAKRNLAKTIKRLVEYSSTVSNAELASALGISRQLVWYHVHRMVLPGRTPRHVSCKGCGRRVAHKNSTKLCRACYVESYAYEFVCAQCGAVRVVTGASAAQRRYRRARRDFCGKSCAMRYRQLAIKRRKKLDPGAAFSYD